MIQSTSVDCCKLCLSACITSGGQGAIRRVEIDLEGPSLQAVNRIALRAYRNDVIDLTIG